MRYNDEVNEPQSELERIVARLLPGIVAEQLAALNPQPQPVWDDVPGRPTVAQPAAVASRDRAPDWYREAGAAAADYANELAHVTFDPEARGVSSDMRRLHWTAVDARDQVMRILADVGRRDKSKDVYAAIGRGREALIRLRAASSGQPVPLQLLTPKELTGAPDVAHSPHTGDRFRWKGTGTSEFLFDRPEPGKPALVEVVGLQAGLQVRYMRRTLETIRQVDTDIVQGKTPTLRVVSPEVTHLKCDACFAPTSWTVRVIHPEQLPRLKDTASGSERAVYWYVGGRRKVILQSLDAITLWFYAPDLKSRTLAQYGGETRAPVEMPAAAGVLRIQTAGRWSIDPAR